MNVPYSIRPHMIVSPAVSAEWVKRQASFLEKVFGSTQLMWWATQMPNNRPQKRTAKLGSGLLPPFHSFPNYSKLWKRVGYLFNITSIHDDVIKWKHFSCYWPFVWRIHRTPVICSHKGQWHRALIFSLSCANGCANNWDAGDLRCHHAHYDVTVMYGSCHCSLPWHVSNM